MPLPCLDPGLGLCLPLNQRTPWGGGKRRGVENLTNDTPPKRGFRPPPRTVLFPPPSGVSALFFLYKISTPEQTRSSFGGVQKFSGERVLWYVFLPPYVLHPPISRPNSILSVFLSWHISFLSCLSLPLFTSVFLSVVLCLSRPLDIHIYIYTYIHTYMYICCEASNWATFGGS